MPSGKTDCVFGDFQAAADDHGAALLQALPVRGGSGGTGPRRPPAPAAAWRRCPPLPASRLTQQALDPVGDGPPADLPQRLDLPGLLGERQGAGEAAVGGGRVPGALVAGGLQQQAADL